MTSDTFRLVDRFGTAGVLGPLDVQFARALARLGAETDPAVLLGAALACRAPAHGHICIQVGSARATVREGADPDAVDALDWPAPDAWLQVLQRSPLVRGPGGGSTPLVLEADRLYLDRYWDYERRLAGRILALAGTPPDDVDLGALRDGLDRLFPGTDPRVERQRQAAQTAVCTRFCVVSGGPGTGKTTTVTRILALLLDQARRRGARPPRIRLFAPTGKAAARLKESVRQGAVALAPALDGDLLAHLPADASTLHRGLGVRPDHPTLLRHGPDRPLAADVVVVDEASMVDFALMTRLLEAVPPAARLILLGDRDQLASVEAGAVLGDICAAGLGGAVVELAGAFRYEQGGGIDALAQAIRRGDEDATMACLAPGPNTDVTLQPSDGNRLPAPIRATILDRLRPCIQAASRGEAAAALAELDAFRVLCAHRRGPLGADAVNREIRNALAEAGLMAPDVAWPPGLPVLVTRNDPALGLFNGDAGLLVVDRNAPAGVIACFAGPGPAEVRSFHPARLPPWEPVFATTVHKSQGSQFDRVVIVLPGRPSPVLTRELLYTAVTRARRRVDVVGTAPVVRAGVRERVRRFSGLRDRLGGLPKGEGRPP